MSDDQYTNGFDEGDGAPRPVEETIRTEPERLGIAWGFVVILILVAIAAVFIIQNNEPISVQFLTMSFELNLWVLVMSVVLVTLLADQAISLGWRRRKRRKIAEKADS